MNLCRVDPYWTQVGPVRHCWLNGSDFPSMTTECPGSIPRVLGLAVFNQLPGQERFNPLFNTYAPFEMTSVKTHDEPIV